MTPEEKWDRLTNPKTPRDYGLIMCKDELETFPEGREFLHILRGKTQTDQDCSEIMRSAGARARETIDRVVCSVLKGER